MTIELDPATIRMLVVALLIICGASVEQLGLVQVSSYPGRHYLRDRFIGVYEPVPGAPVRDTTLTQSQQEMRETIHISKYRPGTPHFWAALAVAGVGGYAYGSTTTIRAIMSWMRHPLANYMVHAGRTNFVRYAGRFYLQTTKAYRYVNYVAFAYSPFATYHHLKAEEYEKAVIQWFGPPGSVHIYEEYFEKESKDTGSSGRPPSKIPGKELPRKKPAKMPQEQRMRLWRMGLRWCRKHRRYDRCSLRARK